MKLCPGRLFCVGYPAGHRCGEQKECSVLLRVCTYSGTSSFSLFPLLESKQTENERRKRGSLPISFPAILILDLTGKFLLRHAWVEQGQHPWPSVPTHPFFQGEFTCLPSLHSTPSPSGRISSFFCASLSPPSHIYWPMVLVFLCRLGSPVSWESLEERDSISLSFVSSSLPWISGTNRSSVDVWWVEKQWLDVRPIAGIHALR